MIKFLVEHPVLLIPKERLLCIADLHLGLEHELYAMGITIPPQRQKFEELLRRLFRKTKAKVLVLLGDVKHKVPGMSFRELREVPELVKWISERVDVHITLGNHDAGIKEILPSKVKVHPASGFKLGNYGFFHGHAWPSKDLLACDYLFMGHVHPAIELKDALGYRSIEQVWAKGKLDKQLVKKRYKVLAIGNLEVTILPAFNPLLGGVTLNTTPNQELIGPLLKKKFLKLKELQLHLLDGTFVGKVADLG
jgi:hypothetical protein